VSKNKTCQRVSSEK